MELNIINKIPIPKYLKIKISKTDSLILSPQLISHFPFLKYQYDILNRFNDKIPEILLHLSNENNNSKRILNSDPYYPFPDSAKIIKYMEKFDSFRDYIMDMLNSEPVVTTYTYKSYGSNVRIRSLGYSSTSPEREEISYLGGSMPEFFTKVSNGLYCLDKYGNKQKVYPPHIIKDYVKEGFSCK